MKKLLNREMAFLVGIAAYIIVLFACSGDISAKAKTMPIAVGVLCLALIVLEAVLMLFKKTPLSDNAKKAEMPSEVNADVEADVQAIEGEAAEAVSQKKKLSEVTQRTIVYIVWLISFGFSIDILGFLATLAIWLFALLRFGSKATWLQTVLITAGTMVFVYVVFVKILAVRFATGLLF